MSRGTTYTIEVNPKIPRRLMRLEELAGNLWYSWDKPTRTLFARLHRGCGRAQGIIRAPFCSASTSSA